MSVELSDHEEGMDEIIRTVFTRGIRSGSEELKYRAILLSYGGKQLAVFIDDKKKEIDTKVESKEDPEEQKPHETSILYAAAKMFMQEAVANGRVKYTYRFVTSNERLKDWACGPGMEIFHWKGPEEYSRSGDRYTSFTVEFRPEPYEPDQPH